MWNRQPDSSTRHPRCRLFFRHQSNRERNMIHTIVAIGTLQHYKMQLERLTFTGNKEISRMMALAECSFRMAVHPDTSDDEAVSLLQNAVRLDGTNPRYAYHLGRIELRRGRLQEAARWYRIAVCLAPTSHRIWAHIAVLQRELNESFKGNENFEPNVLLNYSEAILSKVREGQDNIDPELLSFVPPKSLAAKEQEARQGKQTLKDPAARDTANAPRPSAGVAAATCTPESVVGPGSTSYS